jgi:hypothetical protein
LVTLLPPRHALRKLARESAHPRLGDPLDRWRSLTLRSVALDRLPPDRCDVRFETEPAGGAFDLMVVPASCDELGAHLDELGLGDVDAFERSQPVAVTGDHWKEQRANMLPNDRIATSAITRSPSMWPPLAVRSGRHAGVTAIGVIQQRPEARGRALSRSGCSQTGRLLWRVVQVLHRRPDVGVAHPLLPSSDVRLADRATSIF